MRQVSASSAWWLYFQSWSNQVTLMLRNIAKKFFSKTFSSHLVLGGESGGGINKANTINHSVYYYLMFMSRLEMICALFSKKMLAALNFLLLLLLFGWNIIKLWLIFFMNHENVISLTPPSTTPPPKKKKSVCAWLHCPDKENFKKHDYKIKENLELFTI